jgi:hypothetical protein
MGRASITLADAPATSAELDEVRKGTFTITNRASSAPTSGCRSSTSPSRPFSRSAGSRSVRRSQPRRYRLTWDPTKGMLAMAFDHRTWTVPTRTSSPTSGSPFRSSPRARPDGARSHGGAGAGAGSGEAGVAGMAGKLSRSYAARASTSGYSAIPATVAPWSSVRRRPPRSRPRGRRRGALDARLASLGRYEHRRRLESVSLPEGD